MKKTLDFKVRDYNAREMFGRRNDIIHRNKKAYSRKIKHKNLYYFY